MLYRHYETGDSQAEEQLSLHFLLLAQCWHEMFLRR